MTAKEDQDPRKQYFKRIRLIKRLLRPLPRRATIHRYPVLRHFKEHARKNVYLWSFREQHVVPAIYVGCILSLWPIYGIQLILAFFIALAARANYLVTAILQFITNPITVWTLYPLCYLIGDYTMGLFGVEHVEVSVDAMQGASDAGIIDLVKQIISGSGTDAPGILAGKIVHFFIATTLGGTLLGLGIAVILHALYILFRKRAENGMVALKEHSKQLNQKVKQAAATRAQKKHKNDPPDTD